MTDLQALGCSDCIPEVQPGRVDGELTVLVGHSSTCPWIERVAGGAARIESPFGCIVHSRGGEVG